MAAVVCTLPPSVYFATTKKLPTEALYEKTKTCMKCIFIAYIYIWWLFRGLFITYAHCILKPIGCCVGLPVSQRESRCRCGGRRGGLNDSQHCAVGPGLQSPQRWSFPPASISLAVSLHSARSSSSLSIQPFRYAETSTFFPISQFEYNRGRLFLLPQADPVTSAAKFEPTEYFIGSPRVQ